MADIQDPKDQLESTVDLSRVLVQNVNHLKSALKGTGQELDKEFGSVMRSLAKDLNALATDYDKMATNDLKRSEAVKLQKKLTGDIVNAKREQKKLEEGALKIAQTQAAAAQKMFNRIKEELKGKTSLTVQEQQRLDLAKRAVESTKKTLELTTETVDATKKLIEETQTQIDNVDSYVEGWDKANLKIAAGSKLLKGIGKIPILGSIMDTNKGLEVMQKSARGGATAVQAFGKGITAAFEGISKSTVILAIIDALYKVGKFFFEMMVQADETATKLAKNLVISKEEARGVVDRFNGLVSAVNEGDRSLVKLPPHMRLLVKETVAAQDAFNKLYGLAVDFSNTNDEANNKFIMQLTAITKIAGLSEEEQKGLTALYAQRGEDVQKIERSTLTTASAYKALTGYQINQGKILKEVYSTSNAIKLAIKGGTDALVQSVINAQHLGVSMGKIESIAEGMLDFESSIKNQLEAELLTSREINLNRLRYASATGDTVAVTEELNKLVKEAGPDFEKNVFAQQAMAQALGISRQELADMVTQQKVLEATRTAADKVKEKDLMKQLNLTEDQVAAFRSGALSGTKLYEIIKQAGLKAEDFFGAEAEKALGAQTAQEKFNEALERAKEKFSILVANNGLLDRLADFISDFISVVSEHGLGGLWSVFGKSEIEKKQEAAAYNRAQNTVNTLGKKKESELSEEEKKDLRSAQSILANAAQEANEEELSKLRGVKDFTINPLPEDTITASGRGGITIAGGTRLGRTDEMVAELKQQNRLLAALLAKDTTLQVDGQTLANTVAKNVPTSYGNLLNPGSSTYNS